MSPFFFFRLSSSRPSSSFPSPLLALFVPSPPSLASTARQPRQTSQPPPQLPNTQTSQTLPLVIPQLLLALSLPSPQPPAGDRVSPSLSCPTRSLQGISRYARSSQPPLVLTPSRLERSLSGSSHLVLSCPPVWPDPVLGSCFADLKILYLH